MPETTIGPTTELSEAEYRKLTKQVRAYQLAKRGTAKKTKPVLRPVGETNVCESKIIVEKSSVDWSYITDEVFSLDINATQLFIKIGKERARNLRTGKCIPVAGASVFRCFI